MSRNHPSTRTSFNPGLALLEERLVLSGVAAPSTNIFTIASQFAKIALTTGVTPDANFAGNASQIYGIAQQAAQDKTDENSFANYLKHHDGTTDEAAQAGQIADQAQADAAALQAAQAANQQMASDLIQGIKAQINQKTIDNIDDLNADIVSLQHQFASLPPDQQAAAQAALQKTELQLEDGSKVEIKQFTDFLGAEEHAVVSIEYADGKYITKTLGQVMNDESEAEKQEPELIDQGNNDNDNNNNNNNNNDNNNNDNNNNDNNNNNNNSLKNTPTNQLESELPTDQQLLAQAQAEASNDSDPSLQAQAQAIVNQLQARISLIQSTLASRGVSQ